MACRDVERGRQAVERANLESNTNNCFFERLDLASFDSIRQFSNNFHTNYNRLDILINNAGKPSKKQKLLYGIPIIHKKPLINSNNKFTTRHTTQISLNIQVIFIIIT